MKLNMLVTFGLCLALSANAYALISVTDSSNADWLANPNLLRADPDDRGTNGAEVDQWGAVIQTDGGTDYLYMYFEDNTQMAGYTDQIGATPEGWSTDDFFFAAVHIDVDRTAGNLPYTWSLLGYDSGNVPRYGWNSDSSIGYADDQAGPELWFPLPSDINNQAMMGTDTCIEWGMNAEGFNFWGSANLDGIWDQGPPATDSNNRYDYSQTSYGANYIEFKVSIQKIKDMVATMPDGVVPKKVWKVAIRLAGHNVGGGWDADKSGDGSNPGFGSGYNTFIYVPVETLLGDTNDDQNVDLTDYGNLASAWGTTGNVIGWDVGDFDADGDVDLDDYGLLASNWGLSYVPEPVTLTLLGLGGVALLRRRK